MVLQSRGTVTEAETLAIQSLTQIKYFMLNTASLRACRFDFYTSTGYARHSLIMFSLCPAVRPVV